MSGAFPAHPVKGPTAMQPAQKIIPRRVASVVGPTQSFFMRQSKAMGVSQFTPFHILGILWPKEADAVGQGQDSIQFESI